MVPKESDLSSTVAQSILQLFLKFDCAYRYNAPRHQENCSRIRHVYLSDLHHIWGIGLLMSSSKSSSYEVWGADSSLLSWQNYDHKSAKNPRPASTAVCSSGAQLL